jgi:hypothetical protein
MKYQVTSVETGYVVHESDSPASAWTWVFEHGGTSVYQARAVTDEWAAAARRLQQPLQLTGEHMTLYIYSNETGQQVARIEGPDSTECEQLAQQEWNSNDFHYSYVDAPVSNAV